MIAYLKKLFNKEQDECSTLPENEKSSFFLKVDNHTLGVLISDKGEWLFKYTDEFKKLQDQYKTIVGFPDLNKEYHSELLWPFFQIRIPGLKQPAIKEIIAKENINEKNEAALLKRFGRKSISNPYELLPA